jgi:hypothetical protein
MKTGFFKAFFQEKIHLIRLVQMGLSVGILWGRIHLHGAWARLLACRYPRKSPLG